MFKKKYENYITKDKVKNTFKDEKCTSVHLSHHTLQCGQEKVLVSSPSSSNIMSLHCTVNDLHRHCCRLLKKNARLPNSAHRARSDTFIRQCGPSTTTRLCLQRQHTGNNPSLGLQLYAEQTSQSSLSVKRI